MLRKRIKERNKETEKEWRWYRGGETIRDWEKRDGNILNWKRGKNEEMKGKERRKNVEFKAVKGKNVK